MTKLSFQNNKKQPTAPRRRAVRKLPHPSLIALGITACLAFVLLSFPSILAFQIKNELAEPAKKPFPVSVNPLERTITENPEVETLLKTEGTTMSAAAIQARGIFADIATLIASVPGYQLVSAVGIRFVTVYPGFRKEQVANAFGKVMMWTPQEQKEFLALVASSSPTLLEGTFAPGTYIVSDTTTAEDIQHMLHDRFYDTISSRYSEKASQVVPVEDALTIASMLERETSDPQEMRLISGIIWNRIWSDMNLQIDATLQYAKSTASAGKNNQWWPKIVPKDKYIKSLYNTYLHEGLTPTPIANPSVAAVVAALNPKKTDCLFYFHDKKGDFHCTATYKEHVAMLKKYFGQGK